MSKKCARCLKTVYPVEELKCLDKTWHKGCFRCTECGMALTLKNYKGFNRMPYCSAHTPKVQATPIASTPELKRLTNNTRIQSNVKYHEDYERGKGRCVQTADGTEIIRSKQNTKMHSNVAYHVEKFEHGNIVEQRKRELDEVMRKKPSHRLHFDRAHSGTLRPSLINLYQAKTETQKPLSNSGSCYSNYSNCTESSLFSTKLTNLQCKSNKSISKQSSNSSKLTNFTSSFDSNLVSMESVGSASENSLKEQRLSAGNAPEAIEEIFLRRALDKGNLSSSSVESALSEVDNLNNLSSGNDSVTPSNITLTPASSNIVAETSSKWQKEEELEDVTNFMDADPLPELEIGESAETVIASQKSVLLERKSSYINLPVYRAVYDFDEHDIDEVSFRQGDLIFEVEPENSGWMIGRVERTGRIGMLPVYYVEPLKGKSQIEAAQKLAKCDNQDTIDDTVEV